MADSISYTPTTWADGADGGTPITAARLNNIEQGINNATTQVNANTKDIKTLGDSVSRFNPVAPVTKFDVGIDGESQVYIRVYYGSTKVGVTFSKKGTFEYW